MTGCCVQNIAFSLVSSNPTNPYDLIHICSPSHVPTPRRECTSDRRTSQDRFDRCAMYTYGKNEANLVPDSCTQNGGTVLKGVVNMLTLLAPK